MLNNPRLNESVGQECSMLNKELNDEECDATKVDHGTEAGYTIINYCFKELT